MIRVLKKKKNKITLDTRPALPKWGELALHFGLPFRTEKKFHRPNVRDIVVGNVQNSAYIQQIISMFRA